MLVLCCISLVSAGLSVRDQEIYPSTFAIGEFRLDSVPRAEVLGLLPEKIIARDGRFLKLYFADTGQTLELPMEKCGVYFDFNATLQALDLQLFTGGPGGLYNHSIIRGSLEPVEVKPVMILREPDKLNRELAYIKQNYDRQALDAVAWVADDTVSCRPHQDGRCMDLEATAARVVEGLQAGLLGPFQVQAALQPARISSDDIAQVEQLLGLAAGSLDRQNEETLNHLNGLKNDINGCILKEGDTLLLLNEDLPGGGGSRTVVAANGAAEIIAGACIDAGLFVEEKPQGYEIGNREETPVMLWLDGSGYAMVAEVYGHQTASGKKVRLVTKKSSGRAEDDVYYKEVTMGGQEPVETVLYDPSGPEAGPPASSEQPLTPDLLNNRTEGPADMFFKSK